MKWYLKCLKQYADFNGRARRSEYWFFVLFNVIISFVITFVVTFLEVLAGGTGILGTMISYIYCLVVLIPGIAVGVRRLHDVGKSGWFLLIGLIPIVGALYLLVLYCLDSLPDSNQWGENPKNVLQ